VEDDTMAEYNELVGGAENDKNDDIDATKGVTAADVVKKESMNESVSRKGKKYLNVLSEGMDSKRQSALEGEIERMRKLAKLGNND
jgi:hypothetical protein